MELYKRDFFIARIMAGYIPVKIRNTRFCITHPNADIDVMSNELYIEAYEAGLEAELMTRDELLSALITQGIWSQKEEEEYKTILPKHIEYWKIELYNSLLKSNTKKQVVKYLRTAKKEYNRLSYIRNYYNYVTVAGYAEYIKNSFIISQCATINNKGIKWDEHNLATIMTAYNQAMLNADQIRELSRTAPWVGMWPTLKLNGNIFSSPITFEQQSLLSWSSMYDKIYESPDCPPEHVIDYDDMLDGWLLIQKRKREEERGRSEIESVIGNKMSGADEIFIPVETVDDAEKINLLNPTHVKSIKKNRLNQIQKQGVVKQQEFKDVQQKRSMEMRQAYAKTITGGQ